MVAPQFAKDNSGEYGSRPFSLTVAISTPYRAYWGSTAGPAVPKQALVRRVTKAENEAVSGGAFCPTPNTGSVDTRIPAPERKENSTRTRPSPLPRKKTPLDRAPSRCPVPVPSPAVPNAVRSSRTFLRLSDNAQNADSICMPANNANTSTPRAASNAVSQSPPEFLRKINATTASSSRSA